jgi:DNA repair exonuclease SbcCD nuclease subunit
MNPRIQRRRRGNDFFSNYYRILDYAQANHANLIIHGGDVFFRSKVPPSIVDQAYEPLLKIANSGIPIYLVPGNHERSQLPAHLWLAHRNIHVFNRPRTYRQQVGGELIALSGFPFTRKVRQNFRSLLHQTDYMGTKAAIHFLCLHQTFEGAKVGPLDFTFRSDPDNIPGSEIPNEFTAILSGHIHRSQQLTHTLDRRPLASPVIYSGSIERTSFAERFEEKHFVFIKIYPTLRKPDPIIEYHQLPTRPMVKLEFHARWKSLAEMEQLIRIELSRLDPDSIVQIHLIGDDADKAREALSATFLRDISPPTMNTSVAYPWNNVERNPQFELD